MFGRNTLRGAVALTVVAVATPVLAGTAGASAPAHLSFSASSDGASAGWSSHKGSTIDLTLGSMPATTFAMVTINHEAGVAVSSLVEPTFTTDNYNAGSPRYYLTLSNNDTLWGYPPNAGLNGTDFAWQVDNAGPYMPWSSVQTAEPTATVADAYVIADGDQQAGTVDQIDQLQFAGTTFNH